MASLIQLRHTNGARVLAVPGQAGLLVQRRLGFGRVHEFSDHVTERGNTCDRGISPCAPPSSAPSWAGRSARRRTRHEAHRARRVNIAEKPFLSGESDMSLLIANLEHRQSKHGLFREPGDVHVHSRAAVTLSCTDQVETRNGDRFEVEAAALRLPLDRMAAASSTVLPL